MPVNGEARPPQALRVAFVGQGVYFQQCAQTVAAGGLIPSFIDFRNGAPGPLLLSSLEQIDPDVVLVFRPEIVPGGLFASLRAVTIGYLTEPLPRGHRRHHADLRQRMEWLREVDAENFDRVVSFDPLIADTAGSVLPVWRSLPLPVEDSFFMDVPERSRPPRLLFVGRSTEHREALLEPIKRRHRIVHIGHGLFGDELKRFLARADVQLNLHNNPYPTFENRVCLALAAGHLVISEPLSPDHGLRSGQDYLEANSAAAFGRFADELARDHGAYLEVQRAGRESAERFRASYVFPELIRDAVADIAESGTTRRRA